MLYYFYILKFLIQASVGDLATSVCAIHEADLKAIFQWCFSLSSDVLDSPFSRQAIKEGRSVLSEAAYKMIYVSHNPL